MIYKVAAPDEYRLAASRPLGAEYHGIPRQRRNIAACRLQHGRSYRHRLWSAVQVHPCLLWPISLQTSLRPARRSFRTALVSSYSQGASLHRRRQCYRQSQEPARRHKPAYDTALPMRNGHLHHQRSPDLLSSWLWPKLSQPYPRRHTCSRQTDRHLCSAPVFPSCRLLYSGDKNRPCLCGLYSLPQSYRG